MDNPSKTVELLEGYLLDPSILYEAESMCLGVHIKLILCERNFARFEVGSGEEMEIWNFDVVTRSESKPEFTCSGTEKSKSPRPLDLLVWHRAAEIMLALRECHARAVAKKQNAKGRREHAEEPSM